MIMPWSTAEQSQCQLVKRTKHIWEVGCICI